jgi:Fe-S-cluster-containing hydrogenase component 2
MKSAILNLEINVSKCTACRACELSCSFIKEGTFSPSLSRIRVMQVHAAGLNVPIVCVNCSDAPCIPACPVGAIFHDPSVPTVRINAEECIGCGDCVRACPFGAVEMSPQGDVAMMCDLCDGEPECAANCIYGALTFKPGRAAGDSRRWITAKAVAERVRQNRKATYETNDITTPNP